MFISRIFNLIKYFICFKGVEKHGRLLQFFAETAQVKSHAVVAYITDLLENNEKFVVFAHHQSMMNSIETQLVKKVRHDLNSSKTFKT